jgi:hypothetical protein
MVMGVAGATGLRDCDGLMETNTSKFRKTEIYLMRLILEIQFFLSNSDEIKNPCMNRFLLFFLLSIVILSSLNPCSKCYDCNFGKGHVRELCSKDFPDGTSGLKLTVEAYEKQGYKCFQK